MNRGQAEEAAAQMGITLIFSHQLSAKFSYCVKLIGMHRKEKGSGDETE